MVGLSATSRGDGARQRYATSRPAVTGQSRPGCSRIGTTRARHARYDRGTAHNGVATEVWVRVVPARGGRRGTRTCRDRRGSLWINVPPLEPNLGDWSSAGCGPPQRARERPADRRQYLGKAMPSSAATSCAAWCGTARIRASTFGDESERVEDHGRGLMGERASRATPGCRDSLQGLKGLHLTGAKWQFAMQI
jgi:hypothetical protein